MPGNPKIRELEGRVSTSRTLALGELDISLVAPDGNEVVILDDPPAAAAGTTAPQIHSTYDDEAGLPSSLFGVNKPMIWQPESLARLGWFKNQNAGGLWTLNVRDDAGVGSGTLNGWSIDVARPGHPALPGRQHERLHPGLRGVNDGGYTHSGTADEWDYGLPAFAPITTAHSGTKAWKTDLDNTYNNAPTGLSGSTRAALAEHRPHGDDGRPDQLRVGDEVQPRGLELGPCVRRDP